MAVINNRAVDTNITLCAYVTYYVHTYISFSLSFNNYIYVIVHKERLWVSDAQKE